MLLQHAFIRKVWGRIQRQCAEKINKTPLIIPSDFKAVSFSFDDFPESAINVACILENVGACGTFYVCFGLLDKDSPSGKIASLEQVKKLAENGHEIACYTYDHLNCS